MAKIKLRRKRGEGRVSEMPSYVLHYDVYVSMCSRCRNLALKKQKIDLGNLKFRKFFCNFLPKNFYKTDVTSEKDEKKGKINNMRCMRIVEINFKKLELESSTLSRFQTDPLLFTQTVAIELKYFILDIH